MFDLDPIDEALLLAVTIYVATMALALRISYDIILNWGMVPTVASVVIAIMVTAALIARKGAQFVIRDVIDTNRRLEQQ